MPFVIQECCKLTTLEATLKIPTKETNEFLASFTRAIQKISQRKEVSFCAASPAVACGTLPAGKRIRGGEMNLNIRGWLNSLKNCNGFWQKQKRANHRTCKNKTALLGQLLLQLLPSFHLHVFSFLFSCPFIIHLLPGKCKGWPNRPVNQYHLLSEAQQFSRYSPGIAWQLEVGFCQNSKWSNHSSQATGSKSNFSQNQNQLFGWGAFSGTALASKPGRGV